MNKTYRITVSGESDYYFDMWLDDAEQSVIRRFVRTAQQNEQAYCAHISMKLSKQNGLQSSRQDQLNRERKEAEAAKRFQALPPEEQERIMKERAESRIRTTVATEEGMMRMFQRASEQKRTEHYKKVEE